MTRLIQDVSGLKLMATLSRAGFEKLIRPYFSPSDQAKIMRAYRLSKYGHKDQKREGGGRYFEHPKALAILLVRLGVRDVSVICAALLHDIIEDTFILELDDIEVWFGADTCVIVKLVTKEKGLTRTQYIVRLSLGDPRAWLVKCADRLHNMSTLESDDPAMIDHWTKKKAKQCRETRKKILPLAEKLAQTPGYEELGAYFVKALTYWCERREREVRLCT